MIRVVVVDDDFRIAGIHAAYVDKVDGFQAIAQAHTAAEAVAAADPGRWRRRAWSGVVWVTGSWSG